jgi:hypothetical protein
VVALGEIMAVLDGGDRGVLVTIPAPLRVGDRLYLGGRVTCLEVPRGAREAFTAMLRIHDARASSGASTGDLLAALRDFGERWQSSTGRERTALGKALGCMRAATRQDDLDGCTAALRKPPTLPLACSRYLQFLTTCAAELPEPRRAAVRQLEVETERAWNELTDDGALARLCAEELVAAIDTVKACPRSTASASDAPRRDPGEAAIPDGAKRPTAELQRLVGRSPEEEVAAARAVLAAFAKGPGKRAPEELTSALETVAAVDTEAPVVETLLRYALVRTPEHDVFVHAVRHALVKRSDPEIAERLADLARGGEPGLRAFALAHGAVAWEPTHGVTTTRLLLDRLDPTTLPVFLEQLEAPLTQPPGLAGKALDNWKLAQAERLKLAMFGAGHLATDAELERLAAVVSDAALDRTNQRMNAAAAIAMVGSPAAQDLLLDLFAAERDESFRASLLQLVALALDDRRLVRFDEVVQPDDAARPRSHELNHALAKNEPLMRYLAVVRACREERACYLQKLQSGRQDEQVKALAVLGRGRFGDDAELRAAIVKTLDNTPISRSDVRRFGVLALARIGAPEDGRALARIGASLDEEEVFWRKELLQLGTAISRRPPRPPRGL